jgi:hypothetical protein
MPLADQPPNRPNQGRVSVISSPNVEMAKNRAVKLAYASPDVEMARTGARGVLIGRPVQASDAAPRTTAALRPPKPNDVDSTRR